MRTSLDPRLASARVLAASGEWRALVDLVRPHTADPGALGGELILLYGEALARGGSDREACDWLTRTESLLVDRGDHFTHRHALNLLGVTRFGIGQLDKATSAIGRALELASQEGDLLLLARASNNMGAIANLQGRHETALSYYRLAIPTYQRLGDRRGIAQTHHNMAISFRDLGDLERADEEERNANESASGGTSPRIVAMARVGRAEIALRRGDFRLAEMTARSAIDELSGFDEADAHRLLGTALGGRGFYDDALAAFGRALSIAVALGHALTEAEALRDRALMHAQRGASDLAANDAVRAIALFDRMGAGEEKKRMDELLGALTAR